MSLAAYLEGIAVEASIDWSEWEAKLCALIVDDETRDAAHDLLHIERVVANARRLAEEEGARLEVVVPAAYLHDCVVVRKDSPQRSQASRLAAHRAGVLLAEAGYPAGFVPAIRHAIEAHSFSAQIEARTLEAKVVQDADRLEALGAVGIARCLQTGGTLQRPLYDAAEPFPQQRIPDDFENSIDHFFVKLLKLPATMQTASGKREAVSRKDFMLLYLQQLGREIGVVGPQSCLLDA